MQSKIISRYIAKEIFLTMISVTTIVVFIFICNQFVRYLGFVVSGKYAAGTLLHLIFLQVPILFGYLLPLGFFLGILLTLGRLYAESELTVMSACGLSRLQLLNLILEPAILVFLVVTVLVLGIGPYVALKRDQMIDVAESSTIFQTIMPGRFQVSKDGGRVFYIESMSRGRDHAHNIFVAEEQMHQKPNADGALPWMVLSARGGFQKVDKGTNAHYVVTTNGYRYAGTPGQKDFQIVKFDQYGVQVDVPTLTTQHEGEEVIPTMRLIPLIFHSKEFMAEFQWRLSLPLSVIILTLIAVPLSYVKPRQGRFAKLVPAVIIYMVYANMMFVSRSWLEDGKISAYVGLWWIHAVMLILGLILFFRFMRSKSG